MGRGRGPVSDGYDFPPGVEVTDESMLDSHYSQERNDLDQVCSELDRLRAELAETRAAAADTDELREEAFREIQAGHQVALNAGATVDSLQPLRNALGALNRMRNRWRSVRGDAPAEPPADPEPTRWSTLDDAMRVAHERPLISTCTWHSRIECVCPVHDVVGRLSDAGMLRDAAPAAAPELPVVELPVTLSSPDAVGKVCETRGLSRRLYLWEEREGGRSVTVFPGARGGAVAVMWWVGDEDTGSGGTVATLPYPVPSLLLVAAIEAARGGSR